MESFTIQKVLNNNVLIATHSSYQEVVLIGKGIGFGKKHGDIVPQSVAEKMFVLENQKEQDQYKKLVSYIEEDFIEVMNDLIHFIKEKVQTHLHEHIHVALTDHISFAIKRTQQGIGVSNPFLTETKSLYPLEFEIAQEVVATIKRRVGVELPAGEIAFIALHIHSALSDQTISKVNSHSNLLSSIVEMVEDGLKIKIDRESVHYLRLIRHLHYTVSRVEAGEQVEESKSLANLLKNEYPICYNLSWKVMKVMQQSLKLPVDDAEAVYLTMHLQRLVVKGN